MSKPLSDIEMTVVERILQRTKGREHDYSWNTLVYYALRMKDEIELSRAQAGLTAIPAQESQK